MALSDVAKVAYEDLIKKRLEQDVLFVSALQIIDSVASNAEVELRVDGRLLLASNLHDLVIVPLERDARSKGIFFNGTVPAAMLSMIYEDIRNTIDVAKVIADNYGVEEISSTILIKAISTVVSNLKIDDLKLWGR